MKYVPPVGGAAGEAYVDASPGLGIEGDAVPAAAIEAPLREIDHTITVSGLTPNPADLTQLAQAIQALIANSLSGINTTLTPGLGLDLDGAGNLRVRLADASLVRNEYGLKVNAAITKLAVNTALTATNHNLANIVATASVTLTLPKASTAGMMAFAVLAQNGAVTITPNAADSIQGAPPAESYVIMQGASTWVVTDGISAWSVLFATGGLAPPQGRLSLTSGVPVMTADTTAAGTVYYVPYIGRQIPLYNGVAWTALDMGNQLTLTLNASAQLAGCVYDIFAWNNGGAVALGTGPVWASSTSRGTGAGTKRRGELTLPLGRHQSNDLLPKRSWIVLM